MPIHMQAQRELSSVIMRESLLQLALSLFLMLHVIGCVHLVMQRPDVILKLLSNKKLIIGKKSATAAEAITMREGLSLANCLGCNNVQAESDSIETVQACTDEESWSGESSAIFAHFIDLATIIGNVKFQHCPREVNGVAHELARACFSDKLSYNWVDEPPRFIIDRLHP
jgi:hypothetical protein